MTGREPFLFSLYRRALMLYPRGFRQQYSEQILCTLSDCLGDLQGSRWRFWCGTYSDLLGSASTQRLLAFEGPGMEKSIKIHTLGVLLVLTLLGGVGEVTMQQLLRRGADEPQLEMASLYASKIVGGEAPELSFPSAHVDLERSLEPFLIFYGDDEKPRASTGFLNAVPPVPPPGVFAHARQFGRHNLTWQPRRGVRLATVLRRVEGSRPGFLLAGRSLRIVEREESLLWRLAIAGWIGVVALVAAGAAFLSRAERRKQKISAAM